jgi:hypothetical protein
MRLIGIKKKPVKKFLTKIRMTELKFKNSKIEYTIRGGNIIIIKSHYFLMLCSGHNISLMLCPGHNMVLMLCPRQSIYLMLCPGHNIRK